MTKFYGTYQSVAGEVTESVFSTKFKRGLQ